MASVAEKETAQGGMLFSRQSAYPSAEVRASIAAARDRVYGEIDRLNLWGAVAELDSKGYCVLPPERAAAPGFAKALADALLRCSAEDNGVEPDVEKGTTHENLLSRHGNVEIIEPLLHRDRIFREAPMNENLLAVVTYLLGESCQLISNSGQIKGPGAHHLPLHTDQGLSGGPTSFTSLANVCNAVWVLTDYSEAEGATSFVPGSHRLCRHPTEGEILDPANYTPLDVKAGSILIWHGNTWHGSVPRTKPGLRLGVIHFFARWNFGHRVNAGLTTHITDEQVAEMPPRFAYMIGKKAAITRDESGTAPAALYSEFG